MQLRNVEEAFRFATAVIQSGLAPSQFNSAEKVIIAVQYGAEIGFTPMQALQSIAVINGRPTIWGDALPALAWSSGVAEEVNEYFEGSGDTLTAVCETKRKGQSQICRRSFSVADAKRAHLWGKKGPWTDYPQRMLQMRARSWSFRDNFADALKGMQIREEVQGYSVVIEDKPQAPAISFDDYEPPIDAPVEEPDSIPTAAYLLDEINTSDDPEHIRRQLVTAETHRANYGEEEYEAIVKAGNAALKKLADFNLKG